MTDAAAQQGMPAEEPKQSECAGAQEGIGAEPDAFEQRIVQRVEQAVRAVSAGARRVRSVLRERVTGGSARTAQSSSASEASGELFRVPDEVRGLVERYPLPAILASCGAGYLLGAILAKRRRP